MDFTIEKYRELLLALKEAGYELMRYDEYCEGKRAERMVVMRHDVDRSVERARRLAEVEKEMGVRTSYYFREKFVLNNGDDIKYIAGLGHEVGYHYEDLVAEKGDVDKAYARCMRNIGILRKLVDVKTITMHGSPMSGIDAKRIWEKYDYREMGVIGEPQIDVDWGEMFYLTDTGRSWNGVSRRDKVALMQSEWEAKGWVYKMTDDVIKAVRNGSFPKRMMMTTHPQRWADGCGEWMWELMMQGVKNFVKKFFIRNKE